jgi:alpha/beta superfamily hydrolase
VFGLPKSLVYPFTNRKADYEAEARQKSSVLVVRSSDPTITAGTYFSYCRMPVYIEASAVSGHMSDNYTSPMNRTDIAGLSAVRRFFLMTVILSIEACAMAHANNFTSDLEDSVCGIVREPFAFWQFRRTAGVPDESRVRSIRNIARLSFTTRDGRELGGYKLRADHPQGYLLVAQGNAMLADQIMGVLTFFRDYGLDVYVYDYRGYGISRGKSRLKAIVSDYREIVASLNAQGYGRRYLYGMSMGGVILTNAIGPSEDYDALVLDSPPSRVSSLGCPEDYDPVRNLPQDGARLLLIIGLKDRVVPPGDIEELSHILEQRGGRVLKSPEFAHPLMDLDPAIRQRRLQSVADFLAR